MRRSNLIARAGFALVLFAPGLLPAEAGRPQHAFDLDALDSYVPALMRKRGTAGLQICIEKAVNRLCKSYGVMDLEKSPVTDDTLFLAAGLLRPFAALAVDPSVQIETNAGRFRIRDLVSESAGLLPSEHLVRAGRPAQLESALRTGLRSGVPSPSAANWFLISKELERSGKPALQLVLDRMRPLGGESAMVEGEIQLGTGKRSSGLTVAGYRLFPTPPPQTTVPVLDGFWTNARTYQAAVAKLPASSFESLARNPDAGVGPSGAGAGFEILEDPCKPGVFARVQGERGTFSSLAAVRPGDWSIVILANSGRSHSLRELVHFVRKWVFTGSACPFYEKASLVEEDIYGDYRPLDSANPGFATSFFQDLRIEPSEDGPALSGMFDAATSAQIVRMEDGSYIVRGGAAMDGWKLVFHREDGKVRGFVSEFGSYKRIPALFSMRGYPVLVALILFSLLGGTVVFLIRKRRNR